MTWRINAESAVLPRQHYQRTGIPSRVTVMPTTWGKSVAVVLGLAEATKP